MRLSNIQITNLAGLRDLNTNIPAVAIITGRHGAGKSSFERALMYAFGRRPLAEKGGRAVQHDPSILRGTAASGEATLTFSADSDVEFLRVRVKPDSTERKIKMRGAKKWEDAADVIDDITNALGYNPMSFKDLAARDRLEAFLRVAKVEVSREDIQIAAGDDLLALPDKPGLDTINSVYDGIYKARTVSNGAADTQEKYAAGLESALPPPSPAGDWNADAVRLRAEKAGESADRQREIDIAAVALVGCRDRATAQRRESEAASDSTINAEVSEIQDQIAALRNKIATLEGKRSTAKLDAAEVEAGYIDEAREQCNTEVAAINQRHSPRLAQLSADIATAEERARHAAQAEGTRKAAATARAEAAGHRAKAKSNTESLERLTELKATTGKRMKIQGVTIASPREGQPVDICREEDGALIPFEIWNDADKDTFCLKMAILYRGPCGIVCIDSMGNWSPARQEGVIAACRKYAVAENMQFLLGRASDSGDLEITDVSVAPVVAPADELG